MCCRFCEFEKFDGLASEDTLTCVRCHNKTSWVDLISDNEWKNKHRTELIDKICQ